MNQRIALLVAVGMLAVAPGVWAQGPGGPPRVAQRQVFIRVRGQGCGPAWGRAGGMRRMGPMGMGRAHWRGRGRSAFGMMAAWPMLQRRLGLTSAQSQQIADAFFTWQKSRIMARANEQIGRLQLARLMHGAQPDESAVDGQLQRLEQLRLTAAEAKVHFGIAVRQVLTPAQWQKLHAMRGGMMMRHRQGGMQGGRGGWGHSRTMPPPMNPKS